MAQTLCRMIAPKWLKDESPTLKPVLEGMFNAEDIKTLNGVGYNVYYLPNSPSRYDSGTIVDGSQIDTFNFVFVDYDTKSNLYSSKEAFIEAVADFSLRPSSIVDSGNGIHVYWRMSDLNPSTYLRLQRRLVRHLKTDETTCSIYQLMRLPGTQNTKVKDAFLPCEELFSADNTYTCEQMDKVLPAIEARDEQFCEQHYNKTYQLDRQNIQVDDKLPAKFGTLLKNNPEVKDLWSSPTSDRSKNDFRLGHLMFANNFTKDEARSVLVNSAKALQRAPIHRVSYAENIIDKIWTFEEKGPEELSSSVDEILSQSDDETLKGKRFPAQPFFDGTEYGFRIGQVIGLCAGVGVGKTAVALNLFKGFVERNPEYIHMFVTLEMPARQIARRWKKMCGNDRGLHKKVHVLSNYNADGSYRQLSLSEIKDYLLKFQSQTGKKIGCVCLDHIGILRQQDKSGEYQGLRDVCEQLKSFAIETETLFVVQSQTSRDKASIGDIELFKDAGFGTQSFEGFLDFLMVCWQPLKRCYDYPQCPRVTAYKFAKIREKSKNDIIIEDQCYRLLFEQDTETLRPLYQDEETPFDYYAKTAITRRNKDKKTDLVTYTSVKWGNSHGN